MAVKPGAVLNGRRKRKRRIGSRLCRSQWEKSTQGDAGVRLYKRGASRFRGQSDDSADGEGSLTKPLESEEVRMRGSNKEIRCCVRNSDETERQRFADEMF